MERIPVFFSLFSVLPIMNENLYSPEMVAIKIIKKETKT